MSSIILGGGRKLSDSVKYARQLNALLNGKGARKPRAVGPRECAKSENCKAMHGKAAPICDTKTHKCRPRKTRGGDGETPEMEGGRARLTESQRQGRLLNALLNGKGALKPRAVGPRECAKSENCKAMHGKAAPVCDTKTHKCRPRKTRS
jgi:hypothetical protein